MLRYQRYKEPKMRKKSIDEYCKVKDFDVRLEVSDIPQGSPEKIVKRFYHKCFSYDVDCHIDSDLSKPRLKDCLLEKQFKDKKHSK
jgi:hypothetical protein